MIGSALALIAGGWYLFRPELLFIDRTVSEALPKAVLLASGTFRGLAHETKGQASIHQTADKTRILRLTDFQTSNGPDVRVYLVAAPDSSDSESVRKAGFIDLGAMKGNKGDQNYDVPMGVDLKRYRSVSIWCRRFSVNFAAAPLQAKNTGWVSGIGRLNY